MDILDDMGVSKLSAKVFLKVNYSFNISVFGTFRCSAGVHEGSDVESAPGSSSQQDLHQHAVWVPQQAPICSLSKQACQWI